MMKRRPCGQQVTAVGRCSLSAKISWLAILTAAFLSSGALAAQVTGAPVRESSHTGSGSQVPEGRLTMTGSTFDITAQCGQARVGRFIGKFETPNVMMYTRRGLPPPLTLRDMDNLGESNSGMLQVSISDFADTTSEDALLSMKGGLKEFCGMGAAGRKEAMIVTLRDAFAGQNGMPASDTWVTVNSLGGQKKLELAKYLSMLAAMRPDAAECLSDEVMFDVSQKRAKKSVDRCIEFTDACIKARSDGKLPPAMCLFAPISGACYERERERGAAELANKAVEGFSICGLGTGEGFSETLKMVEVSVSKLPSDKPRIMHGVGTPEEVLACVGLGADLFETSYPSMLTSQGCALLYSVTYADVMGDAPGCVDESSSVGGKLNLRDNRLRKEMVPIKQGCECFACKRHTRGYIHHLINTHEMLADVLLNMHNQHQYALFFGGIRDSIQAGKFDEYKERFLAKRRSA